MKFKMTLLAVALCGGLTAQAQTNSVPNTPPSVTQLAKDIASVISGSGWTAGGGIGHSISGSGRSVAGFGVAYDFNNTPIGLYLGYDYLFSKTQSQQNVVKGGITVNATIEPLAFLSSSLTNITATLYAGELMATGIGNNAVGAITVTGAKIHLTNFKNFEISVDPWYENRQGQAGWDGHYVGAYIMATRMF